MVLQTSPLFSFGTESYLEHFLGIEPSHGGFADRRLPTWRKVHINVGPIVGIRIQIA